MSKQLSAAIILFYCLVRMVSAVYTPYRDSVGDIAHYYRRDDQATSTDDDYTALLGTWYMTGASSNMQSMMINSNLSQVQGMSCGCAYMDLSSDQDTMDQDTTDDDNDQCNDTKDINVMTYCNLTMAGNPSATGQIITTGCAIPQNNMTNISSETNTFTYTIDTLILALGNNPPMNQSIPVNYTTEIHNKLLNASSDCSDDSQRYTALYTRDTTVNETLFKDLVNQAGDQGKDLVQLNTTCANSTTM
ncbi:hypothetical protein LRAMOSA03300 [Lichtheimia ramosa]|uniref:Lipocalin/cytosolic fatty-acid binding domain-containing protein n=1 Tax=Lichtheimia ramosa TaxID=688394 RepID=A0A077WTX1_9FUNG|nr:hypothetical protein LRAMOSA03300 [Lichtheimia ramosa]